MVADYSTCERCGGPKRPRAARYCSRRCLYAAMRPAIRLCAHCGAPCPRINKRYCSNRCANDARIAAHVARFWLRVEKTNDCWLWRGDIRNGGYGRFHSRGVGHQAHRFAYALTYGPIPDGRLVLHRCDNPPCCRPDHLFCGTTLDNVHDKLLKRRDRCGVDHYRHKLSDDDVRAIRALSTTTRSRRDVGRQFHVSHRAVTNIWLGVSWKHIA